MMLLKCYPQYVSKFGKLSSGHRTGKGSVYIPRPKNTQTTTQVRSFHMLARLCSRSFKLGFSSMWTKNFQMYKLISRRQRNQKSNHQQFIGSWRKQGSSRKTSTYASLTILESLTVWITTNCGEFLKSWEYQTTFPASWETCLQVKKQQLEPE